jgi:hypothetical protein
MSDLRWFKTYLRENCLSIHEDVRRGQIADTLLAALLALPATAVACGVATPAAIESRHVVLWLVVTAVILLVVVSPFRIWQAQDLRSAMLHVQIADLEYQLADQRNESLMQEVLDGLSRHIELGSKLQQALEKGTDPVSQQRGREAWAKATELFLCGHLGESYAEKFRAPRATALTDPPGDMSATGMECWSDIQAKKDAVAAILTEIAPERRQSDQGLVLQLAAAASRG